MDISGVRFDRLSQLSLLLRTPEAWPKHPMDGVPTFDLGHWAFVKVSEIRAEVCGTTCCACGLAAIAFPEWGLKLSDPAPGRLGGWSRNSQLLYINNEDKNDFDRSLESQFLDVGLTFGLPDEEITFDNYTGEIYTSEIDEDGSRTRTYLITEYLFSPCAYLTNTNPTLVADRIDRLIAYFKAKAV